MFKYIFLMRKLRALQRLHKRHLLEHDSWIATMGQYEGREDRSYCYKEAKNHMQEAYKIENLIKFLT